ncbi:unnamed protein product [Prunus armeniaca]|uniref:Uncharacterized protein n=1 Tax=Prunus armeniaca TaxID=36596 RepID=A0A6J5WHY1_PRUAR|nr:unnamed protein product [Prunus armeniaca]
MHHRKRQKATNAPLYDVASLRCVTVALSASGSYILHVYTKLVLLSILGPGCAFNYREAAVGFVFLKARKSVDPCGPRGRSRLINMGLA